MKYTWSKYFMVLRVAIRRVNELFANCLCHSTTIFSLVHFVQFWNLYENIRICIYMICIQFCNVRIIKYLQRVDDQSLHGNLEYDVLSTMHYSEQFCTLKQTEQIFELKHHDFSTNLTIFAQLSKNNFTITNYNVVFLIHVFMLIVLKCYTPDFKKLNKSWDEL